MTQGEHRQQRQSSKYWVHPVIYQATDLQFQVSASVPSFVVNLLWLRILRDCHSTLPQSNCGIRGLKKSVILATKSGGGWARLLSTHTYHVQRTYSVVLYFYVDLCHSHCYLCAISYCWCSGCQKRFHYPHGQAPKKISGRYYCCALKASMFLLD